MLRMDASPNTAGGIRFLLWIGLAYMECSGLWQRESARFFPETELKCGESETKIKKSQKYKMAKNTAISSKNGCTHNLNIIFKKKLALTY